MADRIKAMASPSDIQILRLVVMREIATLNEYEDLLAAAGDDDVRRFLAHAIQEEKEHVAEAMQLLRGLDAQQDRAMAEDHSAHYGQDGPGARALAMIATHAAAGVEPTPRADPASARSAAGPQSPQPAQSPVSLTVGSLRGQSD